MESPAAFLMLNKTESGLLGTVPAWYQKNITKVEPIKLVGSSYYGHFTIRREWIWRLIIV